MSQQFQQHPYKSGMVSSAFSAGSYLINFLTNDLVLKVAAGAGVFLGLFLTILSIWLMILRIRKEMK